MIPLHQTLEQGRAEKRPQVREQTGAAQLLENAGYHLSRNSRRAVCPKCGTGRTDFTVSISLDKGLYNCHRCNSGGKIRDLAPAFSFAPAAPARVRRADIPKRQFAVWLGARMSELASQERRLARRAVWASAALQLGIGWPIRERAWLTLSDWYASQRQFESFWQNASDKCGRLELYRRWRRGKGV